MSTRTIRVVALLWVLSLLAVGTIGYAQTSGRAQVYMTNPVSPTVVAGPDFGFRIEGEQNGVPVGLPVVRVNGQWVEVKIGSASGKAQPIR